MKKVITGLLAGLIAVASASPAAAATQTGTQPCSGQFPWGVISSQSTGATGLRAPGGTYTQWWQSGGYHARSAIDTNGNPVFYGGSWRAEATSFSWVDPGCQQA